VHEESSVSDREGMVVTDLDGTLLHRNGLISSKDLNTLKALQNRNILRVIATGRSLFSAYRALDRDLPIDFLIFSSGAGTVDWATKRIIQEHTMNMASVKSAAHLLFEMNIEFMIHNPIPHNHTFTYFGTGENNPDFLRRLELYREFATSGSHSSHQFKGACQIVAIEPPEGENSTYHTLQKELPFLKVIRTTSPIDGRSTWIELFPRTVSKAMAAEWLRSLCDVNRESVCSIGNDYNDLDLLNWASSSFLVDNAPDDLKAQFPIVRSSGEDGFSDAVEKWLRTNFAF
jgi:hydroxymethylpyrimidine pyrophosphatase-like HAD family hydrolase